MPVESARKLAAAGPPAVAVRPFISPLCAEDSGGGRLKAPGMWRSKPAEADECLPDFPTAVKLNFTLRANGATC